MSGLGPQGLRRARLRSVLLILGLLMVVAAAGVLAVQWLSDEPAIAQESETTEGGTSESEDLRSLPETPEETDDVSAAPQELGGEPFRLCETCHPDYEQMPPETGDLIFSHPTHTGADVGCATCHASPLGHFGQPAPMMMTCLSCHEGETAPNDCKNCHRKLEEIAPGLDEPVVHLDPSAEERQTCDKCHDVDTWCEQCHGLIMPHPADWTENHGQVGLDDSALCEKCHQSKDPTFCVDCHQVQMPHPPFWYSGHGDIASTNPDACNLCHPGAPQYCNSCHHAGYSPTEEWVPVEHGQAVEDSGTERCFVCHEQAFCEQCHREGRFIKQ